MNFDIPKFNKKLQKGTYMEQNNILILKENGVVLDSSLCFEITKEKLPILYRYKNDKFKYKLIYNHPSYGPQVFNFERCQFTYAYSNSRYLHTTPVDERCDFIALLKVTGLKINPVLEVILRSFKISYSVLSRLGLGCSTSLSPKHNAALHYYDIKRPKLNKSSKSLSKEDSELLNVSLYNMSLAVKKAAQTFDLDLFFDLYVDSYRDYLKAQGKSPAVSLKKIKKQYIDSINQLQK